MSTETHLLRPSGGIPNSMLPVVIFRAALDRRGLSGESACAMLQKNGWGGTWVNGVYPFWHFHTRGHEVLACISGSARIGLGGGAGIVAEVSPGDVCVLPAGVGHKRIEADGRFQVAGAYPPGQEGNIVRPGDMDEEAIGREIAALKLPATDPLTGESNGVVAIWNAKRRASATRD